MHYASHLFWFIQAHDHAHDLELTTLDFFDEHDALKFSD